MNKKFFRFDPAFPVSLHSADDGGGGGNVEDTPEQRAEKIAADVQKKLDAILTKSGGDQASALTTLIKQNHSLENAKNTAETRLRELQVQLPDDATKAEIAAWRALGLKPDELKTELETGRSAKARVAEVERLSELEKAAKEVGFKPNVLKRLSPALPVISKEVDVKGEDGKFTKETRYFFKDGDKETEISDFFEGDTEALELLRATDSSSGSTITPVRVSSARSYVSQGGSGGAPASDDPIAKRQQQREEARKTNPNPLMAPVIATGQKRF